MSKFMNIASYKYAENSYMESELLCETTLATLKGLDIAQESLECIDVVTESAWESIKSVFKKIWDYICQFCDYVKRKFVAAYNWIKSLFIKKKKEADKAKAVLAKAGNAKNNDKTGSNKIPELKSGNTQYLNAGRSEYSSNEEPVKSKSNNRSYLTAGRSEYSSNEEPVKPKSGNTQYLNAGRSEYSSSNNNSTSKTENVNDIETAKKIIEKYNTPIVVHGWIEPQDIFYVAKKYIKITNKVIEVAKKVMNEADTFDYTEDPLKDEIGEETGNLIDLKYDFSTKYMDNNKTIEPDQIEEVLKVIKNVEKEVDILTGLVKGGRNLMEKINNKFSLKKRQIHNFDYYNKRDAFDVKHADQDYNYNIKQTKFNIKKFLNTYTIFFKKYVVNFTRLLSNFITKIIEAVSKSSRVKQIGIPGEPDKITVYI